MNIKAKIRNKIKFKQGFAQYCRQNEVRKLQLGCGHNVIEGFFNTDIDNIWGTYYVDAVKPLPFEDNTFHYIFSEHNFEHFTYQEGKDMLLECLRVLKPGGVLRLTTPDIELLIDIYNNPDKPENKKYIEWHFENFAQEQYEDLGNEYSTALLVNNFMRMWGHECVYDRQTLKRLIEQKGFVNVTFCNVSESTHDALKNVEHHQHIIPEVFNAMETICVEATKPEC